MKEAGVKEAGEKDHSQLLCVSWFLWAASGSSLLTCECPPTPAGLQQKALMALKFSGFFKVPPPTPAAISGSFGLGSTRHPAVPNLKSQFHPGTIFRRKSQSGEGASPHPRLPDSGRNRGLGRKGGVVRGRGDTRHPARGQAWVGRPRLRPRKAASGRGRGAGAKSGFPMGRGSRARRCQGARGIPAIRVEPGPGLRLQTPSDPEKHGELRSRPRGPSAAPAAGLESGCLSGRPGRTDVLIRPRAIFARAGRGIQGRAAWGTPAGKFSRPPPGTGLPGPAWPQPGPARPPHRAPRRSPALPSAACARARGANLPRPARGARGSCGLRA